MTTIPERKTKHYEKYFKHLPAILKVKVKYILFQCSANRNFKQKKIRIRFYNVQSLLSSISIKNIYFCTKKKNRKWSLRWHPLFHRFLHCCFSSLPTVITQLYLLTTLILGTGGCNSFSGKLINIFHCKLTNGFSSAVNNPKHWST